MCLRALGYNNQKTKTLKLQGCDIVFRLKVECCNQHSHIHFWNPQGPQSTSIYLVSPVTQGSSPYLKLKHAVGGRGEDASNSFPIPGTFHSLPPLSIRSFILSYSKNTRKVHQSLLVSSMLACYFMTWPRNAIAGCENFDPYVSSFSIKTYLRHNSTEAPNLCQIAYMFCTLQKMIGNIVLKC